MRKIDLQPWQRTIVGWQIQAALPAGYSILTVIAD